MAEFLWLFFMGHILGDFYFQGVKIAKEKDERIEGIIKHSIEYSIIIMLCVLMVASREMLILGFLYSLSHHLVDLGKFLLLKKGLIKKSGKTFLVDQMFHIFFINIFAYAAFKTGVKIEPVFFIKEFFTSSGVDMVFFSRWLLALLFIFAPGDISIQCVLKWAEPFDARSGNENGRRTGMLIGTLERIAMLIMLYYSRYEAVMLYIIAKCMARSSKINENRQFGEYFLLGTLLSLVEAMISRILFLP